MSQLQSGSTNRTEDTMRITCPESDQPCHCAAIMLTDLAAGLGMVGAGMLVFDAQACELELQQHLAPARAAGEDGGVVAEQGGRQVELLGGRMEAVDDIAGADGDEGSGG